MDTARNRFLFIQKTQEVAADSNKTHYNFSVYSNSNTDILKDLQIYAQNSGENISRLILSSH